MNRTVYDAYVSQIDLSGIKNIHHTGNYQTKWIAYRELLRFLVRWELLVLCNNVYLDLVMPPSESHQRADALLSMILDNNHRVTRSEFKYFYRYRVTNQLFRVEILANNVTRRVKDKNI